MSQVDDINKIVIVGGGSAGWMTAAALANTLGKQCNITLIESDDIGSVGVGEATIPAIKQFNQRLGISEKDFISNTNGSFKLGIEFVDWGKQGHSYFHPFGAYGRNFDVVSLHQYWLRARATGDAESLDEYCMAWWAAKHNKFSLPIADKRNVQSTFDYAYHFDAKSYANYLRDYSEKRHVKRIEGLVTKVHLDNESGDINAVTLDSGESIEADFFIDCSGFRALLIEGELKVGFEDWSHWLKCDRAIAVPSEKTEPLLPYTRSTAQAAGWQWRIPLQHRTGNGYVYSHQHISDNDALDTLMHNLDGKALSEPLLIKFATGRRQKFWHKNCLAIGLSAGFLEPLESTSLHLIQTGITRFLALFPKKNGQFLLQQEYNRITQNEYESVRDFLILHYCQTERRDTDFWRECATMAIPENLQYKIDHFRQSGRIVASDIELFQNPSWLAVFVGQLINVEQYDPLVDARKHVDANKYLSGLRQTMKDTQGIMPDHQQYINAYCRMK
ncbi:MAG: tryptophan 7-halogenase [Colwellia sp.]|nr:tryptophan 7-halogenase [Colwellia sp.]